MITPVYASIGRSLIESLRHPSVVRDREPSRRFGIKPMGIGSAIARSLVNEDRDSAETRWSDATQFGSKMTSPDPAKDVLINEQSVEIPLPPEEAFAPIRRIGGATGWYFATILWKIRGLLDLLMGGVGMRRGRPDPETPLPGTTLDFWRVQIYEPARRLRLFAEMLVPGRAWLEFRAETDGVHTKIKQTAQFEPDGLRGLLYWYALWPIHEVMFRGMLRKIAAQALTATQATPSTTPTGRLVQHS